MRFQEVQIITRQWRYETLQLDVGFVHMISMKMGTIDY